MKTLIAEQMVNVSEFDRFWKNLKACSKVNFTFGYVKGRIEELDKQWAEFRAVNKQILLKLGNKPKEEEYFTKEVYDVYEQKYFSWKGALLDEVDKFLVLRQSAQASEPSMKPHGDGQRQNPEEEVKLPRITLPKFSGKYTDWTSFHDLFVSIVHKSSLPDVQKMHFLKTSLTGEAEYIVKHFTISSANYKPAWDYLCKRYENKRLLVNTQLNLFFSQPNISQESSQAIKRLLDTSLESLESVRALGIDIGSWDPIIVYVMTQKLPTETHQLWEQTLGSTTDLPTFEQLKDFLEVRFRTLEATADKARSFRDNRSKPANSFQTYHNHGVAIPCRICNKGSHSVRHCQQFLKLDAKGRHDVIKRKDCCINCLAQSHTLTDCRNNQGCLKCGRRHNTMLHFASAGNSEPPQVATSSSFVAQNTTLPSKNIPSTSQTVNSGSDPNQSIPNAQAPAFEPRQLGNINMYHSSTQHQVLLATALIYARFNNRQIVLRALIDPGSQASFITESACQVLQLPRLSTMASITGLGKTPTASSQSMVMLTIGSRISNFSMEIEAITLPTLTDLLPSQKVATRDLPTFGEIQLADPNFYSPGKVDIILGADVYPNILLHGLKLGQPGTPLAQNTQFGWILSGRVPSTLPTTRTVTSFFNKADLNAQLQRFWEIEELVPERPLTAEEKLCEELYQQNVIRTASGRYMVRLPFRPSTNESPGLGDSRGMAFRRLTSLKTRFLRDPEFYREYKAAIEDYVANGQLKRVPRSDISIGNMFYLPHHAVYKDTGTAKKLRVVFDASAKNSSGKSLNDVLLTGTPLPQNIAEVIMRFRRHAVAFAADIEKMYPQILLHPKDADYQRILWMDSLDGPVYDLKFEVVVFGVSSSPFLAIRTLRKLAEDERSKYPRAAEIIETDSYVDDILSGGNTVETALEAQTQLIELLKSAGFRLKKWASNKQELLSKIPAADQLVSLPMELTLDTTVKTLGITWNPSRDEFTFRVSLMVPEIKHTKRSVLSTTAKLYDPLGWVAPVVIVAKVFMQTLWLAGLNWDDPLPANLNTQWNAFASTLTNLERIRIPRFLGYDQAISCQILGFSDASEKAYAAVVYMRSINGEGIISVRLLAAKTRVAPVKSISVPRLELCGALLLTHLIQEVRNAMDLKNVPTFAWTDSSIVLTWLHNHPSKWKCFVANRVTDIITVIPPSDWKHISTQDNPADLATRGINPDQIPDCSQWWNGPAWLSSPESEWPTPKFTHLTQDAQDIETRKVTAMVNTQSSKNDMLSEFLTRFSSLSKLLTATAYWHRYCHNCWVHSRRRLYPDQSHSDKSRSGPLTPEEFSLALSYWIRFTQDFNFPEDMAFLKMKREISNRSKVKPLLPFLDEKGIMRLGGRLEQANLGFNQKHPMILPHSSHLTTLIIQDTHTNTLHGGIQLTLNMLRKRFWIVKGRSAVKSCIHRCVVCFRHKGKAAAQLMGNLPTARVTISRPFLNTGVDYAGPVAVRMSKGRGCRAYKGYIAIFICFATRAIHLEVVSDLTTDAFLAALKRFVARRGLCANLYSDCGTNFIGANSSLDKDYRSALKSNANIANLLARDGIKWHFNPPGAPHFGGLWEAGVKSMKHHLRRIMGNATLTYEELSTLVTQIEACLNSRPICPLSDDASELNALTPGHFLVGDALLAPPEPSFENEKLSSLKRWTFLQQLRQGFWRQWSTDYLARLQNRPKWLTKKENFIVGDLVLVKDENLPPLKWPLGRILELHPGSDQVVRVVTVRTQHGTFKRPVIKICLLPIDVERVTPQTSSQ